MTYGLFIIAFSLGLFGSPHCLGMCGGIVTAFGMSMQTLSVAKKSRLIATYHLGRVLSYTFMGVLASVVGITVLQPFITNGAPRIILGMVLVFIGISMLGAPLLNRLEKVGMVLWQKLSPLRQKVFPLTTYPRALAAGLLWGFLPCGLVYGALMMAIVGHSIATGAMLMFAFGLGTVPMLVATQTSVDWMRRHISRLHLRQLNGAVLVLSGLAVITVPLWMANNHSSHSSHLMHGDSHDMHDASLDRHDASLDRHDASQMSGMPHHEHSHNNTE